MNSTEASGAYFSPCRTWRYALWRTWEPELPRVAFCGLNPSTADEEHNDPTVRRCIQFAHDWGYGGMWMLNAFGFRATDPRDMKSSLDPVGPDNDATIERVRRLVKMVVACWGVHGSWLTRGEELLKFLKSMGPVHCLGWTKWLHPKHPLYLPKDTLPILIQEES